MGNTHKHLLIVNPEAGSRATMKALPELERILFNRGADFEFHFTNEPGHATELVKEIGNQFDVIVSVGGDGTINEILNGMPDLDKPLGMIPIGTGNDFARSCSIKPGDLETAVDILLAQDVRNLDVGDVNGRRFINVMGLGFEGRANDIGRLLGFMRGALKYILAIGITFLTYRRKHLKITFDDITIDEDVFLLSIGNGWNVGGGLQLTPKARMDDGLFDLCYVREITRWRILQVFNKLYDGTIDGEPEMEFFQTKKLIIESDKPVPVHVDGEIFKPVPKSFTVQLIPKAQAIIGNWEADTRFNS